MFCDGVCFGMNNLVNIHKLFFIMLHYYASFYNIDSVEDSYKVQGISCTIFLQAFLVNFDLFTWLLVFVLYKSICEYPVYWAFGDCVDVVCGSSRRKVFTVILKGILLRFPAAITFNQYCLFIFLPFNHCFVNSYHVNVFMFVNSILGIVNGNGRHRVISFILPSF